MNKLYDDVNAECRLDQIVTEDSAKTISALGPLPKTSVILLTSLGVCWALIVAYVVYRGIRKKKT